MSVRDPRVIVQKRDNPAIHIVQHDCCRHWNRLRLSGTARTGLGDRGGLGGGGGHWGGRGGGREQLSRLRPEASSVSINTRQTRTTQNIMRYSFSFYAYQVNIAQQNNEIFGEVPCTLVCRQRSKTTSIGLRSRRRARTPSCSTTTMLPSSPVPVSGRATAM